MTDDRTAVITTKDITNARFAREFNRLHKIADDEPAEFIVDHKPNEDYEG